MMNKPQCWFLVVLGFNATLTVKVISWRSVTYMCFPGFLTSATTKLFFPKPPTTFLTSHASSEVRRKNRPERKFASSGYRTHNHKVMSPTRSPLSHPGGAQEQAKARKERTDSEKNTVR